MSDLVRNDFGQKTYLRTSNNGHLKIDIEDATIDGTGLATETNQTNGNQIAKVMGSEDGSTTGTQRQLHTDGSGNLQTNVVNTINVAPSNSSNSHITDDPTNSFCVGLKGRTTIGTATSETFLLCDSDGHLKVDVVSTASAFDGVVKGNDGADGSGTNRTILTDGNGALIVDVSDVSTATSNGITSEQRVQVCGTNDGTNLRTMKTDDDGHLQVDVLSSAQLPASLGQKANASSLSICRSNTTGAFDLSGRTTIGTASTSTKLLCDSAGRLAVNNGLQTSNLGLHLDGGSSTTMTVASGLEGTTKEVSLSDIRCAIVEPSMIGVKITASSTGGSGTDFKFEASFDGSTFTEQTLTNLSASSKSLIIGNLGDGDSFDGIVHLGTKFRFKMANNSGSSCNYTIDLVAHGLNFSQA